MPDVLTTGGKTALMALISNSRVTLAIPVAIFAMNFPDRQILAILAEPIKRDLMLSGTEIGALYGIAFAALYTTTGIPIARLAETANRARIINWSLALFSLIRATCGLASGDLQLLVARIGVAVGEGGTNPPSHSIISDLFPAERRSMAVAIFSVVPNIGLFIGILIGGWVAQLTNWRVAFIVTGLLGLALAIASARILKEPARAAATVLALVLSLAGRAGGFLVGAPADRVGLDDPARRLRIIATINFIVAPLWIAVFLIPDRAIMIGLLVLAGAVLSCFLGPTFATVQSLVDPSVRATTAALLLLLMTLVGLGECRYPKAIGD